MPRRCTSASPMPASASGRRRPANPISTSSRSWPPPRSAAPTRSIRATASSSENADFAQMVIEHGYAFIGPRPEHIRLMGDKIAAKEAMRQLGVPLVPGSDGPVTARGHGARGRRSDRLPGADQGGRRRRRPRHDGRARRGRADRRPGARQARGQGGVRRRPASIWRNTSSARATSRCRSWPTSSATASIWASATAPSSAATRR